MRMLEDHTAALPVLVSSIHTCTMPSFIALRPENVLGHLLIYLFIHPENVLGHPLQGSHVVLENHFSDHKIDPAQGAHDISESPLSAHLSDPALYTASMTSGELLAWHCLCKNSCLAG